MNKGLHEQLETKTVWELLKQPTLFHFSRVRFIWLNG